MTDLDAVTGAGALERLGVSVRHHKINAFQIGVDHVVDSIAAGAAHAKDKNSGFKFSGFGCRNIQRHGGRLRHAG